MEKMTREEAAAQINAAPFLRQAYAEMHHAPLIEGGRTPYIQVNGAGERVHNSADPETNLVTNATSVRHEDFLTIQEVITDVRRRSLTMNQDLIDAGLTIPAKITDQIVGYEKISEQGAASQDMNPNSSDDDDLVFTPAFVPNPITHKGFSVPWRQAGFAYKQSLGMTESVRMVAERLERTLCNGNTDIAVSFADSLHALYGYTTHPNRGQGTISDWTALASQGLIVNELIDQISNMWTAQGGVSNDSLCVYVANDLWNVLQKDYDPGNPSSTILARMKEIAQVRNVKPAEELANGQVVLVELEPRTIQLAIASDIVTLPHIKTSPFESQKLTTYAAMVPLIKVDSRGNTGIRHLTV